MTKLSLKPFNFKFSLVFLLLLILGFNQTYAATNPVYSKRASSNPDDFGKYNCFIPLNFEKSDEAFIQVKNDNPKLKLQSKGDILRYDLTELSNSLHPADKGVCIGMEFLSNPADGSAIQLQFNPDFGDVVVLKGTWFFDLLTIGSAEEKIQWYHLSKGDTTQVNVGNPVDRDALRKSNCLEKNKNRIYSEVTDKYYDKLETCVTFTLRELTPEVKAVNTTGKCLTSATDSKGRRTIAEYDRTILGWWKGLGPFNETCQCYTEVGEGSFSGKKVGIFFNSGNSITKYASIDEAKIGWWDAREEELRWIKAANVCLRENKKQWFNKEIGGCYESLESCSKASCDTGKNNYYYYNDKEFATYDEFIKEINNTCKSKTGAAKDSCILEESKKSTRCDCSQSYNPAYNPIYCMAPGVSPSDPSCSVSCKLLTTDLTTLKPQPIYSPLGFISVFVNFIFWMGVVLFIMNFVSAGIEMVRSGDEPEKMKEATERVTSSIFGLIFLLVVGGLVNYLLDFVSSFLN